VGIEAAVSSSAGTVAYHFGAGLVPVRKGRQAPADTENEEYALEYGTAVIEIHKDAGHAWGACADRR